MPTFADAGLTYRYDGTYEGFLCCVFEAYYAHEDPQTIVGPGEMATSLFSEKIILTEADKAKRVERSIPAKISPAALSMLQYAFLTSLPRKELHMLRFLRQGYHHGAKILNMPGEPSVWRLTEAVRHLMKEAHLLLGFIRFSVQQNVLVATIGPKNFVLPLIASHFLDRFPDEHIFIYDETHGAALLCRPHEFTIVPLDEFKAPPPDEAERKFRSLWHVFYDAAFIKPRHNEKCRMSQMPKRYWQYMTEFAHTKESSYAL